MDWRDADDLVTAGFAGIEVGLTVVVFFGAGHQPAERTAWWSTRQHPRRRRWPFRPAAGKGRAYRRAVAIRRFTGVLHSGAPRYETEAAAWRHAAASVSALEVGGRGSCWA